MAIFPVEEDVEEKLEVGECSLEPFVSFEYSEVEFEAILSCPDSRAPRLRFRLLQHTRGMQKKAIMRESRTTPVMMPGRNALLPALYEYS
jgi:hypothetical protein